MKKYFLIFFVSAFLLFTGNAYALTSFTMTAVAYDHSGQIMDNASVNVRVTIMEGNTIAYTQTFANVATSQFAIFSVDVDGSTDSAAFAAIDVTANMRIRIEVQDGTNWVLSGTQTLTLSQYNTIVIFGNIDLAEHHIIMGSSDDKGEELVVGGDLSAANNGRGSAIFTISNNAVNSAKIADGAIMNSDINASAKIDVSKMAASTTAEDVLLTPNPVAAPVWGKIKNANIDNNAAIKYSKLSFDNNIVAGDIASNAVGSDEIASDAVGRDEIASDAVGRDEIADNAVDRDKITRNAVQFYHIASNAVHSYHIRDRAVTWYKIHSNAVYSSNIVDGEVRSSDIRNRAVTEAKIGINAVRSYHIQDRAVTRNKIGFNAVQGYHIQDRAVTEAKIKNGAVGSAKIAPNAVKSYHIENGTITNLDINSRAAISGTKIYPTFGSQNISTNRNIFVGGDATITGGLTVNSNVRLGNDASQDITTLSSRLVTKYNSVSNPRTPYSIPTGTMVMDINTSRRAITVRLPTRATNGQILYINLHGGNNVTISGANYTDKKLTYVFTNNGWVLFSNL